MDLGEIEESYRKELETCEKEFLESVKNASNFKEVELKYKRATANARANYVSKLVRFLKSSKKLNKTKNKKLKKEKNPLFKVNTNSYDVGLSTRLANRADFLTFKFGFYIRNLLRKITPNSFLYSYYRIKIKVTRLSHKISARMQIMDDKINEFKSRIQEIYKKVTRQKKHSS